MVPTPPPTKREWLLIYLCEGEKSLRQRTRKVGLSSTDPFILKLFIYGLEKFYGVPRDKMRCRLILWEGVNEEEAIEFWSSQLGIRKEQFWKTYYRKKSKIRKGKHPYGTCRIVVNSAELLNKILKDIERLKKELEGSI